MKVRVIRVFRVPACDTRITRNNFGFCKLLPEIPEQNSGFGYFGFGYSGFGFRVTGFLPSPTHVSEVIGSVALGVVGSAAALPGFLAGDYEFVLGGCIVPSHTFHPPERGRVSRLLLLFLQRRYDEPPFLWGEPLGPLIVTEDPSRGRVPSLLCFFPRIPFTWRGRASYTMLPLVVEIMGLNGPGTTDPNGPFFLWGEPPSPPFVMGDLSGGRSVLTTHRVYQKGKVGSYHTSLDG
jgi:hypothetical protein